MSGALAPNNMLVHSIQIPQFDSNLSLNSSFSSAYNIHSDVEQSSHISVVCNFRPESVTNERLPPVRTKVPMSNNSTIAKVLPSISVYNARSLFPTFLYDH